MQLEKIVTLANQKTRIQFLAMERSLRAVGCNLPIWVIPYDDNHFELPEGSTWWEMPEITTWLDSEKVFRMMRKYQCLTTESYQFVDTDVCFLRNPEEVLASVNGFVTSCGHWHNPRETQDVATKQRMLAKSTTWQQQVFNAGQFACDRALYTVQELKQLATSADLVATCLRAWTDQPALNVLVLESGITVTNLTLPPYRMESTWAGDYPGEYEAYWTLATRKPYLIHWAGNQMKFEKPINNLFYQYLTKEERAEWDRELAQKLANQRKSTTSLRARVRRIKQLMHTLLEQ